MQASCYFIVRNGLSMNFFIHGSSAWCLHVLMVRVTALDIQVSLRNPTAMLEDSMMSAKTVYNDIHVVPNSAIAWPVYTCISWTFDNTYM